MCQKHQSQIVSAAKRWNVLSIKSQWNIQQLALLLIAVLTLSFVSRSAPEHVAIMNIFTVHQHLCIEVLVTNSNSYFASLKFCFYQCWSFLSFFPSTSTKENEISSVADPEIRQKLWRRCIKSRFNDERAI